VDRGHDLERLAEDPETIELAAEAMWNAEGGDHTLAWEHLSVQAKRHWRRRARVALASFTQRAIETRGSQE
jgi:hypothetical protein